jgi:tRNA (cmo5U34)-methyltransferase
MNNTKAVFNATASTYDRDRARLVPGYEQFYSAAIELLPRDTSRIVDLGAGSGVFTVWLRQAFPDAHIHLIDFSQPMLDLARTRLGADSNLTYEVADYTTAPLPMDADAVVSALSIHHLDDDDKRALCKRIRSALRPGGVFINADHIAGPTPGLETLYQSRWLEAVRQLGATEQQISDSLFRQTEDRRSPVKDQLHWLREAGFTDVDCWYKASSFAVLTGKRPQ